MDDVSQAMRSCFPEFVVPKRRSTGVHYVENEDYDWWGDGVEAETSAGPENLDGEFQDVEMFLAEHDGECGMDEAYPEAEVAEVLAASWKDKRAELARLQRARKFTQAREVKRSFRVEVEELKKKTQCHRCGKTGHWARECKMPRTSTSHGPAAGAASSSGAGLVEAGEHFVCYVHPGSPERQSMLQALRSKRSETMTEVLLVSSPGFAVLDSGCGRSIIGHETLAQFCQIWEKSNVPQPEIQKEKNVFRFGNGQQETTNELVEMPIVMAGQRGVVRAAVIKGRAPLLMSKHALKKLRAKMDFEGDKLTLFKEAKSVCMVTNEAGQYMVPVSDFGMGSVAPEEDPKSVACQESVESLAVVGSPKDFWEVQGSQVIRVHVEPRVDLFTPCKTECPVPVDQLESRRQTVCLMCATGAEQRHDDCWRGLEAHASMQGEWTGRTVFWIRAPPTPCPEWGAAACEWKPRQWRQLRSCVKQLPNQAPVPGPNDRARKVGYKGPAVIEVFSPPRFAKMLATRGLSCVSADLATGWDFRMPIHRDAMKTLVQDSSAELLVLCPPCTWAGGWYHLNKLYMSPEEVSEKDRTTTLFANFSAELAQIQLAKGGRVLFEHPQGSRIWKLPRMQALSKQMFEVHLDMCRFGLAVPHGRPIKKGTKLLVSHANMRSLQRQCQGNHEHQVVAGNHPEVGSVSRFAGQYPAGFVRAVLRTVKELPDTGVCLVQAGSDQECLAAARVADIVEGKKEQMMQTLLKLHVNLGHPSPSNLARVLKHGGASSVAIDLCREIQCDVCKAQARPSSPPPAQTHRATQFNERVGIDVKYLPGWKPNQKIPAVNIVDYASSFQIVVPLEGRETSESIRRVFLDRWTSWAGVPQEIVVDPAQANISDALTVPQELAGAKISITAAEAHWQLGKVEVHGGWFSKVLAKVIAETMPHNQATWLDCIAAAHTKNELIQMYGMTPAQFLFGRHPRVPSNLLDEPLSVVPATASLYEESLQRSIATRQAARKAVIELQDSKALRAALAARPRRVEAYVPGASVAYWRSQKSHEGSLERGGRWHGPAVVLGYVGRNLVVVHKKQIFRCAPEQVRPSSSEEAQLAETPNMELLGIKHLINSGSLQSRQYIDLVPQQGPNPAEPVSDSQETAASESPGDSAGSGAGVSRQEQFRASHAAEPVRVEPASGTVANQLLSPEDGPEYGPIRRRIAQKSTPIPSVLHRPSAMLQDDFAEMMQEVVPQLVARAIEPDGSAEGARLQK